MDRLATPKQFAMAAVRHSMKLLTVDSGELAMGRCSSMPHSLSRPSSRTSHLVLSPLTRSPRVNASPRVSLRVSPMVSPRRSLVSSQSRRLESQNRVDEMKQKFRDLDLSGDGYLDLQEITVLLRKGRADMTDREIITLYSKIDTNNDGKISFEEFVDYIFSTELSAKRAAKRKSALSKWDGPEQLKVNGVWNVETKSALQRFLLEQKTATGVVAKPQNFVSGQMNTQQVVVLQEVLMQQKTPSALELGQAFVCGIMNGLTTRALHEFLLAEETPTAVQIGKAFLDQDFGDPTVFALQELLVVLRKSRGPGLHAAR